MPVVGNRKSVLTSAKGYAHDPMFQEAEAFQKVAKDMLVTEGVNLFTEPQKALMLGATRDALKEAFTAQAFDASEFQKCNLAEAAELIEDRQAMQEELFENDVEGINENANLASFNPVIGMTFPIHKNILMNNLFDKGAIPKVVAREPKFTISMETRMLVTPEGKEIDMYKEQYKMKDAIDATAPFITVEMNLPEIEGTTDVLTAIGATAEDNLSIESYISAVKTTVYLANGDINPETGEAVTTDGNVDVWLPVQLHFTSNYGEIDRTIMEPVTVKARDPQNTAVYVEKEHVIAGYMRNNKFMLTCADGAITAIRLSARIDTSSAMLKTCSVRWKVRTDLVEIGSAIPMNTTISPEEVKDIGALYNVNQLTKILSMTKLAMGNYKDDKIKEHLDNSFLTMPEDSKIATTFDFAPTQNYALDHVEWRYKTFMDFLDSVVTVLLQVLNDPNMTVSIFGAPEIIRKITPTEYTYQTPSAIGPVTLDFTKTVVTSDKRVYQFIGSDKLRGNYNLILVLCPRNSERIIYRIYDYQMYVSNEIRNMVNYALPAIHAFERWKFVQYQPVQGRIKIEHPTGLTDIAPNTDPIGGRFTNDFNLFK